MWLQHGEFRHFRNYPHLELDWAPHKNIFLGENAAGKTNILEAIYFLSHGRSHRTRHDRELIQWHQGVTKIELLGQSHHHGGSLSLEAQLALSPENSLKTVFKLNGNPVKSRSEVVGKIPTVTFFLSDLLIIRGAPEDRRSALDRSLVQYDPVHFKRMNAYNRVRQQKSQLLKNPPYAIDPDVLESLNQQLVATGAALMMARMTYLQQIETFAQPRYHELSQGRENLTLSYQPCFHQSFDVLSLEILQQSLYEAIRNVQSDELRRGQVLVGPHRDDVQFFLDAHDACLYGSQGQQRSIVLAFKLAEIQVLKHRLQDETTILLLDDVMAELDPTRQHQLLLNLDPRMQVFLTTTHLDSGLKWFIDQADSANIFEVSQGHVVREQTDLMSVIHAKSDER